jgi:hypothetical protein
MDRWQSVREQLTADAARSLANAVEAATSPMGPCQALVASLRNGELNAGIAGCLQSDTCPLPELQACRAAVGSISAMEPAQAALQSVLRDVGVDSVGALMDRPMLAASLFDFSYPWMRSITRLSDETHETVERLTSRIPFVGPAVQAIATRFGAEMLALLATSATHRLEAARGLPVTQVGLSRAACSMYQADVQRPATTRAVLRRMILNGAPANVEAIADYNSLEAFCANDEERSEEANARACTTMIKRMGVVEELGLENAGEVRQGWLPAPGSAVQTALAQTLESSDVTADNPVLIAAETCALVTAQTGSECDLVQFNLLGGVTSLEGTDPRADVARLGTLLTEISSIRTEVGMLGQDIQALVGMVELQQSQLLTVQEQQLQTQQTVAELRELVLRGQRSSQECAVAQGRTIWARHDLLVQMGFVPTGNAAVESARQPASDRAHEDLFRSWCRFGDADAALYTWTAQGGTTALATVPGTFLCELGRNDLPLRIATDLLFAPGEYTLDNDSTQLLSTLAGALQRPFGEDLSGLMRFSGYADPSAVGRRELARMQEDPTLTELRNQYPNWRTDPQVDANRLLARARARNLAAAFGVSDPELQLTVTSGAIDRTCDGASGSDATSTARCRRVDLAFNTATDRWTQNATVQGITFAGCN